MPEENATSLERYLRRLAVGHMLDDRLLQIFVESRDEDAFAVLVRRHGPMVLNLSRRITHDIHVAEDVFQSTFQVLAKKAGKIRQKTSIASWLHRVAYHLAIKEKRRGKKRRAESLNSVDVTSSSETTTDALSWRETLTVLDQELNKLAETYREPLIQCYLEGRTQDEAARRLGLSLGTFRRRLEKARNLLEVRLRRRGVSLSSALGGLLTAGACSVSPTLKAATLAAACMPVVIGAAGPVSFVTLTKKAISAMVALSAKKLALLGVCASAVTLTVVTYAPLGGGSVASDVPRPVPAMKNAFSARPVITAMQEKKVEKATAALEKPSPEVIAAWEKAGAEFGWLPVYDTGYHRIVAEKDNAREVNVPGFRFTMQPLVSLASLPAPAGPFALQLGRFSTDAEMKAVAQFKQLQSLDVSGGKITDAGLTELVGLTHLENLNLTSTQVTDAGMRDVAKLKQLKGLSLLGKRITDASLQELSVLSQMRWLYLGATKVTDTGVAELAKLSELRHLMVITSSKTDTQITDVSAKSLASLTNLESLSLYNAGLTDVGLARLDGLVHLKDLDLTGTRVGGAGLKYLEALTQLRSLSLQETSLTDEGLQEIGALKGLESLNLYGTRISDEGLKGLSQLQGLRSLNLTWCEKVTDVGMLHLAALVKLQDLGLHQTHVTRDSLSVFAGMKELQSLPFAKLTTGDLKIISGMTQLHEFQIDQNEITEADLKALGEIKQLTALDLCASLFSNDGLKHLSQLTKLEKLRVSSPNFSDEGVKALASLAGLRELELLSPLLTGAGMEKLTALKGLKTLRLLNTKIDDAGLKEIARLTQLRDLEIVLSKISDVGLGELKSLTELTFLNLSQNTISDEGLKHVAAMPKIRMIYLAHCKGVTDAGVKELEKLKYLDYLYLDDTKVTNASLQEFAGWPALKTVFLESTAVTAEGVRILQEARPNLAIGYMH